MPMTRGPLPPGVYWRRRLLLACVLATAVLLVVVGVRGPGSDPDPAVTASRSGAETSSTPAPTAEPSGPVTATPTPTPRAGKAGKAGRGGLSLFGPSTPPLATPVGRCADSDIRVTPTIEGGVAGRTVPLSLSVQTVEADACTWSVSARHLAVTITRDGAEIWTSRECPGLIPEEDLVVRRVVPTELVLDWSGRRSERGCAQSAWVEPGSLQVDAAAYGGEPGETEFDLASPAPDVVDVPAPEKQPDPQPQQKQPQQKQPDRQPGKQSEQPNQSDQSRPSD